MSKKIDTLNLFIENPTRRFHIREVSRLLGITPMTARKYLSELEREGMIKPEKGKTVSEYIANAGSQGFRDRKVFHTIRKIRESGLIEYLEDKLDYPAVILFGSAARGTDTEESDIDLLVVAETREEPGLSRFEKKLGKGIQIFLATKAELKSGKNKELYNNALNGIVLSGFVEAF